MSNTETSSEEDTFEGARIRVIEVTKYVARGVEDWYWRDLLNHVIALPQDMSHECLDDELRKAFFARYTDWEKTEDYDGGGWWRFYCEFMAKKDWKNQIVRDALTWQDVAGVLSILPL